MEESRWRKHVTWDDPEEIEAKYEELSSKIDNVLNPMSLSEFKSGIEGLKDSSIGMREQLDSSRKGPSELLQKKHEKIVFEIKDVQSKSTELHWSDIVTHGSVKEFLKQYFPKSGKILKNEFLGFLEFEFPNFLASEEVREELGNLLSVDRGSKYISINALQLLTRDNGLEGFIEQIFERVDDSLKESKAVINEQILQEVTEIKDILDSRSIELDKRESKIAARESKLLKLENMLLTEFKEKLEKQASVVKEKLSKDINVQMKRLQGLERNVNDLVKLARSKQQSLTRSELSMKSSSSSDTTAKLKARISSLEKSNECLKTKLSILELESKTDKSSIVKLTEELNRLKARSSMLEQSLSSAKKPEPEKPAEIIVVKEEPEKKVQVQNDSSLFLSLLATFIKCCKLTLPVIHAPGSPKSVSHKVSMIEDEESSIGELFFPAFNKLVPSLVECAPFIQKLKNKEDQIEIVDFLWKMLIYAWSEDFPQGNRKFNPNNLQFEPTSAVWKQKLANIRKKPTRKPLYSLFTNLSVHKVLSFYLLKWINSKTNPKLSLISAFLLILTSVSGKKILFGLNFVKEHFCEEFSNEGFAEFVHVLVALLDSPDDISSIACEILLSLTVDHLPEVLSQCCNESVVFRISEACKKVLMNGMKIGSVTDQEESLIVLLQKLSSSEYLQIQLKSHNLNEILMQRASYSGSNSFFQNNLNSIIRNLSI